MSAARLERMRVVITRHVEDGAVPGLVALGNWRGEPHIEAIGTEALDDDTPMRSDTIFRIASVTKPIVAAAAMSLVEECGLRLEAFCGSDCSSRSA